MTTPHTPEPYRQECDGEQVYITGSDGLERVCTMAAAGRGQRLRDSARIVACVNACAGMADPGAEIARLVRLVDRLHAIIRWRGLGQRTHAPDEMPNYEPTTEGQIMLEAEATLEMLKTK